MVQLVLMFAALSLVIVLSGIVLTRYADRLAKRVGLSQTMGGVVLLALATSLPELAVDVRAAAIGAIDLAVGSTMGSSLYNLLLLALLDLGRRPDGRMLSPVAAAHGLSATASTVLVSIAVLFIVIPNPIGIGRISLGSLLIAATYLLFLRLIFFDQRYAMMRDAVVDGEKISSSVEPVRWVVIGYLTATAVVFLSATLLVPVSDQLAIKSGLGRTFVGTALVAFASSLPEIVTTITAIRMGAISLAVGNIFGSNAFNMVILLPADLIYAGNLFSDADDVNAVTGLCVVIVTAVCLAGLLYRPDREGGLEPDAKAIIGLILLSFVLIFCLR